MQRLKRTLSVTLLLFLLLSAAIGHAAIPERPRELTFVNDLAGLLSAGEEQNLTAVLAGIEQATTAEVVIVTVPTLGRLTAFDFAQRLFTQWGIGKRDQNNGLLLLVSTEEREFRFHTGYGLEGALPDGHLGSLHRAHIVPAFGQGRFYDGFLAVLLADDGIVKRLEREYNVTVDVGTVTQAQVGRQTQGYLGGGLNILVVLILILMLSTRGGRGLLWFLLGHSIGNMNRRGRGGPFGGGGFGGGFGGGRSGGGGAGGRW